MSNWQRLIKALFFIIILGFGFTQPAFGQTGTVVRIEPNYVEVDPGESFTVAVEIANVKELYGFDVAISYDPSVIAFVDYELGDFLEAGLEVPITHEPGTARCVLAQAGSDPKSGSGTLCIFNFVAEDLSAESDLILSISELSDCESYLIENQTENGFVQVGEPKGGNETFIPLLLFNAGKTK